MIKKTNKINHHFAFKYCINCGEKYIPTGREDRTCFMCKSKLQRAIALNKIKNSSEPFKMRYNPILKGLSIKNFI